MSLTFHLLHSETQSPHLSISLIGNCAVSQQVQVRYALNATELLLWLALFISPRPQLRRSPAACLESLAH
jgi:hypothetical protein